MVDKQRTKLVEQRATNAQTIAFVADQEATTVDQAEALAKGPEYTGFAARERANRERLRDMVEEERRLAQELLAREPEEPTVEVPAEQAKRNQALLPHAAGTEAEAGKALSSGEDGVDGAVPGTCLSGAGVASGMGIGPSMAMLEEAQLSHQEPDEPGLA